MILSLKSMSEENGSDKKGSRNSTFISKIKSLKRSGLPLISVQKCTPNSEHEKCTYHECRKPGGSPIDIDFSHLISDKNV